MSEFTPEESRRIDELIATEFENATKDDIELYARWRVYQARKHGEFEAAKEYWDKQYQMVKDHYDNLAAKSEEVLDMKIATAKARYMANKAVKDEQQKQA